MADIVRDDAANQYRLTVDGETAVVIDYTDNGETVALVSTRTDDKFGGQGLGTELVSYALRDIRERGLAVNPVCPFVAHVLETNDEFADLR